jgi:hypothetical protein
MRATCPHHEDRQPSECLHCGLENAYAKEIAKLRDENRRLRALAKFGAFALCVIESDPTIENDPFMVLVRDYPARNGLLDADGNFTDLAKLSEESS